MRQTKRFQYWILGLGLLAFIALGSSSGYSYLGDDRSRDGVAEEIDGDKNAKQKEPKSPGADTKTGAEGTPDSIKAEIERQLKAKKEAEEKTAPPKTADTKDEKPVEKVETNKLADAIVAVGGADNAQYVADTLKDIDAFFKEYPDTIDCANGDKATNMQEKVRSAFENAFVNASYSLQIEGQKIREASGDAAFKQYISSELYELSSSIERKVAAEECPDTPQLLAQYDTDEYYNAPDTSGAFGSSGSSGSGGSSSGNGSDAPTGAQSYPSGFDVSGDGANVADNSPGPQQSYPPIPRSDPDMSFGDGALFLRMRSSHEPNRAEACVFFANGAFVESCAKKFDEVAWDRRDKITATIKRNTYQKIAIICKNIKSGACEENGSAEVRVNSGYRTKNSQRKVNPGVTNSQHTAATAIDTVYSDRSTPGRIHSLCLGLNKGKLIGGCGKYSWGNHIDTRGYAASW